MKGRKLVSWIIAIIPAAVLVILALLAVYKTVTSSYSVIIKDKNMNYHRGANLLVCGDAVFCRLDSESAGERSMLPAEDPSRYSFRVLKMSDIVSIEFIHEEDAAAAETASINPQYLGRYKIQLQGHEGVLILGVSKERLYGTVRFPQWGKGAVEYLKGVRVSSGEVRFLRSASNAEEMKRLGANYLFKQKFSGTYTSNGKVIKGFMVNDRGEKYEWEAVRR